MLLDLEVSTHEIISLGETAYTLLSFGRGGNVLAAVSNAVYLLTDDGEVIWLATAASPMHRRCLRLSSALPALAGGMEYKVRGWRVETGAGAILDFSRSAVWESPTLPARGSVESVHLPGLIGAVFHELSTHTSPAGWGNLIPSILRAANRQSPPGEIDIKDTLPLAARSGISKIMLACMGHDLRLILESASGLVGLGAGLTPSGDDFLGGLFFAIEMLRRSFPERLDWTAWNYSNFIQQSKPLTNLISYTLLNDHANGHTLEPLQSLSNALLTGQPAERCIPFADELVPLGHSTGWDLLTGFLTGLSMLFP